MLLYNLSMNVEHKTAAPDNLKTGKRWIPTLETTWRAPAKGHLLAPSSSALHHSRSIWRCHRDLPGCAWLLWERSNDRKSVNLCSCTVQHISLTVLCPKWKNWLDMSNCRSTRNQSCARTKTYKNCNITSIVLCGPFSDTVPTKQTLVASQKHFIWLQYVVLDFMTLFLQPVCCLKLCSPTSLAAPALSRWFCPQHHDSAKQLYHKLSLTKRGHASRDWASTEYFTKIYSQKCYS